MHNLAPIDHEQDFVSKAYVDKAIDDLNISEYAKALDLEKKVDKVTGMGLSSNDYTTEDKNKLASLENYDDTEVKNAISTNANAIEALQKWYDDVGSKFTKESDGSIKMTGDFFTTGENSAGGMGSELVDIEDLASRVTALETSGGMPNVNIKVTTLGLYNQQSITSTAMSSIAGLTVAIAENMVKGAYNKVVDNGGTYPKIWNYTATKSSTSTMTICFSYGDGINTKESCRLDYSSSTGKWSIEIDEL